MHKSYVPEGKEAYSIKEAAILLGEHPNTVRRKFLEGKKDYEGYRNNKGKIFIYLDPEKAEEQRLVKEQEKPDNNIYNIKPSHILDEKILDVLKDEIENRNDQIKILKEENINLCNKVEQIVLKDARIEGLEEKLNIRDVQITEFKNRVDELRTDRKQWIVHAKRTKSELIEVKQASRVGWSVAAVITLLFLGFSIYTAINANLKTVEASQSIFDVEPASGS